MGCCPGLQSAVVLRLLEPRKLLKSTPGMPLDMSIFEVRQSYITPHQIFKRVSIVCCVGYEPHSALPTALPMVFCEHSPIVPPALKSVKTLATSAVRICLPAVHR